MLARELVDGVFEVAVFQFTCNAVHDDSFHRFCNAPHDGGRTQLERTVDALIEHRALRAADSSKTTVTRVNVKFVWAWGAEGEGSSSLTLTQKPSAHSETLPERRVLHVRGRLVTKDSLNGVLRLVKEKLPFSKWDRTWALSDSRIAACRFDGAVTVTEYLVRVLPKDLRVENVANVAVGMSMERTV